VITHLIRHQTRGARPHDVIRSEIEEKAEHLDLSIAVDKQSVNLKEQTVNFKAYSVRAG
jgi:hypothetical protein